MLRLTTTLIVLSLGTSAFAADFKVKLTGGWNGKTVPAGQHCRLHGGKGKTPPMTISGLPEGTEWVLVEYNDRDYKPLSKKGGHGSIGYPVSGTSVKLPAVAARSNKLPNGIFVHKKARSKGDYASKGYLPPCSGGKGNRYFADVHAMQGKKKKLGSVRVEMGKY